MFLFLFLSSLSMMKCCVLSGSTIRLGIVLLSPHSQALGPGHAAAERHLGGFPLRRGFLYQGFLLPQTGAAGMHQQLSPDWRGSTPSSSFSSYLTVRNNTYSHCAAMHAFLVLMPHSLLCLSASFPLPLLLQILPSSWLDQPNSQHCLWLKACCVHVIFSLTAQMQITVTVAVIGKSWPSQAVCFGSF